MFPGGFFPFFVAYSVRQSHGVEDACVSRVAEHIDGYEASARRAAESNGVLHNKSIMMATSPQAAGTTCPYVAASGPPFGSSILSKRLSSGYGYLRHNRQYP